MKTKNLSSKAKQQEPLHQAGDEAVQQAGEEGAAYMQINKKTKKKKDKKMMMKVLEEEAEIDAEEKNEATTATTQTTLDKPNGEKTDSRKPKLEKTEDSEEDPVIDATTTTTPATTLNKPDGEKTKSQKSTLKKKKRLLKEAEKADKRGVCYLSRIPPHMDHVNLRQILSQYGDIERIFLAPKDSSAQLPSKPSRRSQNTAFTEGWVEFTNKSVAKRVANMLNGEQIGGKKRSSFYYDLWNIKYLSKFKWDDLTEELAFKKAVREQKLALELSAAKRERDFYMSRVDQSRALSAIEERLKKKQKVEQGSGQMTKVIRHFPQTKPIVANAKKSKPAVSDDLLDAVFGGS